MFYDVWNKYQFVNSYLQDLITARDLMFDEELFTGYIQQNQPTRQRSMPMSTPSSH